MFVGIRDTFPSSRPPNKNLKNLGDRLATTFYGRLMNLQPVPQNSYNAARPSNPLKLRRENILNGVDDSVTSIQSRIRQVRIMALHGKLTPDFTAENNTLFPIST